MPSLPEDAEPSAPSHYAARIRVQVVERADGGRAHLLVLSSGNTSLCLAVLGDATEASLSVGTALRDSRADTYPAEDLLRGLATQPLTASFARDLGLFFGGLPHLMQDVVQALDILTDPGPFRTEVRTRIPDFLRPKDHDFHFRQDTSRTPGNAISAFCLRLPRHTPPDLREGLPDAPGTLVLELPANARLHPCLGLLPVIRKHLAPWYASLDETIRPAGLPCRSYATWSPAAFAFYAADGNVGLRRRQAAALHPLFAPALANDADLSVPVDEGRPFEDALLGLCREAIRTAAPEVCPERFDLPRLRRLRGLQPPERVVEAGFMQGFLRAIARMPLHLVPADPMAWETFLSIGFDVVAAPAFGHLDPACAYRGIPRDWNLAPLGRPFMIAANPGNLNPLMIGLQDMLARAASELGPAVLGPNAAPAKAVTVAEAALLEGLGLAAAWELQAAWHEGVDSFTAFLDFGAGIAWQALCAPFQAPNGVVLRCLVTPRELIEEGGRGPDPEGVDGLAHCVGGYVRQCVEARSNILSASIVRNGKRERLSTIEICPNPYPGMFVHQHLGYRNGPPPAEAIEALDAFLDAAKEGRHALDLPKPFKAMAAMAREPSDPTRVYDAWRPYMTERAGADGLEGLRGRFRNDA